VKKKQTKTGLPAMTLFGVPGLPEIRPNDDLPALIDGALRRARFRLRAGDICVVTQKIVSKAEGALADLNQITPSEFALNLSRKVGKDPRLLEVILRESRRIVRMDRDIMICETRHGWICANAGVDQSNIPGETIVALLPADPDRSARKIRLRLKKLCNADIPVIIADTFGRPWREGVTNVAVGVAGLAAVIDWRGKKDDCGRKLQRTLLAVADEMAAAAELVMGKTGRLPVVIIRGLPYRKAATGSRPLLRSPEKDLFR
jgi:coenzyme F420-0:L-glutamate ligase / coenzyme F420-1:gamma-L-glutamate ligase